MLSTKILFKKRLAIPNLEKVFFFPQVVLGIFVVMLTFTPQSTESVLKSVFVLKIIIFWQKISSPFWFNWHRRGVWLMREEKNKSNATQSIPHRFHLENLTFHE